MSVLVEFESVLTDDLLGKYHSETTEKINKLVEHQFRINYLSVISDLLQKRAPLRQLDDFVDYDNIDQFFADAGDYEDQKEVEHMARMSNLRDASLLFDVS